MVKFQISESMGTVAAVKDGYSRPGSSMLSTLNLLSWDQLVELWGWAGSCLVTHHEGALSADLAIVKGYDARDGSSAFLLVWLECCYYLSIWALLSDHWLPA